MHRLWLQCEVGEVDVGPRRGNGTGHYISLTRILQFMIRILKFRYGQVCVTTVSLFMKQWQQVMLEHKVRKLMTL